MENVFSIDQCKIFNELLTNILETFDDEIYFERNKNYMSNCDDPLLILMTEKCNDDYRLNLIKSFTDLYGLNLKFISCNFIYEINGHTLSYIQYIHKKYWRCIRDRRHLVSLYKLFVMSKIVIDETDLKLIIYDCIDNGVHIKCLVQLCRYIDNNTVCTMINSIICNIFSKELNLTTGIELYILAIILYYVETTRINFVIQTDIVDAYCKYFNTTHCNLLEVTKYITLNHSFKDDVSSWKSVFVHTINQVEAPDILNICPYINL